MVKKAENSLLTKSNFHEILTATGEGSGIEAEQEQALSIKEPFDPEKIDVMTRSMTVDLLISRIKSGAINLAPDFQRQAGIWTDERQSRLIESLLLRIPLPTLYAAEDEKENWAIVDGIQRLTAIARFIDPKIIDAELLQLSGLEYLASEFNDAYYTELPTRLQRRIRETELVIHVIRNGTPEEVKFNIFARINTGGVPLSSQELRHALIPGPSRRYLRDWAKLPEFVSATDGSIRDDRMADRELVLRFVAFRLSDKKYSTKDFDNFLRLAMRTLNTFSKSQVNEVKDDFIRSMKAAKEIFGLYAFRKIYGPEYSRYPINKALYEAMSVGLADLSDDELENLIKKRSKVIDAFIKVMHDPAFDRSISQGTGDPAKVRYRFDAIRKMFKALA